MAYTCGAFKVDGEKLEPIKPLAWYPDNLAWVLQASRMQLRKVPLLERSATNFFVEMLNA